MGWHVSTIFNFFCRLQFYVEDRYSPRCNRLLAQPQQSSLTKDEQFEERRHWRKTKCLKRDVTDERRKAWRETTLKALSSAEVTGGQWGLKPVALTVPLSQSSLLLYLCLAPCACGTRGGPKSSCPFEETIYWQFSLVGCLTSQQQASVSQGRIC